MRVYIRVCVCLRACLCVSVSLWDIRYFQLIRENESAHTRHPHESLLSGAGNQWTRTHRYCNHVLVVIGRDSPWQQAQRCDTPQPDLYLWQTALWQVHNGPVFSQTTTYLLCLFCDTSNIFNCIELHERNFDITTISRLLRENICWSLLWVGEWRCFSWTSFF